jgi:tetratricopeptide (TPR) repeat protein
MELTVATIYALLAGLGLVTIDSIVSSQSVYLEAKTAHVLENEGYSKEVIDQIFLTRFKEISATKSLIKGAALTSSKAKPVSAALAELVNLEEALIAIQTLVGVVQSKVILSAVVEVGDKNVTIVGGGTTGMMPQYEASEKTSHKLVLSGFSKDSGYFVIKVENDPDAPMDLDELIREGAYQIVLKLNPYIAALHRMETAVSQGTSLEPVKAMIEGLIDVLPDRPIDPDRARLENLLGLVALLQEDLELAEMYFTQAIASDPDSHVATLNMAFVDLHHDRNHQAIARVDRIAQPWYWPATGNDLLLAAAHVIRGVALSGLGRETEAVGEFRYATTINPKSSEAYFYWSHVANYTTGIEEAQELLLKSKQNSTNFENYAEVAMFYFWLSDANNMPLVRRGMYGYR